MKKICVITASRSEYGLLRWIMEEIQQEKELTLQLIVTGAHLSPEFGNTYRDIKEDGFTINEKVEMLLSSDTPCGITKSMGLCSIGIGEALSRLAPDLLLILGDRFELLPICSAAVVMNIPIAHISGGDITEGAIDNQVRFAVTKMAHIHFPGNHESAERIISMGESPERTFDVGEPGLDSFNRLDTLSREQLAEKYQLDINKKWILMTYHPETMISLTENLTRIDTLLEVLLEQEDSQVIITGANNDPGGNTINEKLSFFAAAQKKMFCFHMSLGQFGYISMMKEVSLVIGNSSSGIFEAPTVKKAVINIGDRQKGRLCADNIVTVTGEKQSIKDAFTLIKTADFARKLEGTVNPYGTGNTAAAMKKILVRLLAENSREELLYKKFYTKEPENV